MSQREALRVDPSNSSSKEQTHGVPSGLSMTAPPQSDRPSDAVVWGTLAVGATNPGAVVVVAWRPWAATGTRAGGAPPQEAKPAVRALIPITIRAHRRPAMARHNSLPHELARRGLSLVPSCDEWHPGRNAVVPLRSGTSGTDQGGQGARFDEGSYHRCD